jgi:hypothetical protein
MIARNSYFKFTGLRSLPVNFLQYLQVDFRIETTNKTKMTIMEKETGNQLKGHLTVNSLLLI